MYIYVFVPIQIIHWPTNLKLVTYFSVNLMHREYFSQGNTKLTIYMFNIKLFLDDSQLAKCKLES